MIVIEGRRKRSEPRVDFEALTTSQLLALHERHFGPLDGRSKERMLDGARMHGWDRTWEMDGLAA